MKKLLVIAAAALFAGSVANAQDIMKQTGGEQNFEVMFKPLGGSPIGINGIKYRKFTSATTAIRASVFLGFGSSTEISGQDSNNNDLKSTTSNFDISIAPGIEQHFVGTDRLSPYIGGEAVIGFSTNGTKDQVEIGTDIKDIKSSMGSFNIGLNAIAGMDFYFADNIYLGAEFGFGLLFTKDLTSKQDVIGTDGAITTAETKGGSSINLGPNAVGAIRLGFLF